jgi:hypothetical protein
MTTQTMQTWSFAAKLGVLVAAVMAIVVAALFLAAR